MNLTGDLWNTLRGLGLPIEDYVILGSGPLYARGLLTVPPGDLDILARGEAWAKALTLGPVQRGARGDQVIRLAAGRIEVFDGWAPMSWDWNAVIEAAELFEGLPFARIEYVLESKRVLLRAKDRAHIALIEKYLCEGGQPPGGTRSDRRQT